MAMKIFLTVKVSNFRLLNFIKKEIKKKNTEAKGNFECLSIVFRVPLCDMFYLVFQVFIYLFQIYFLVICFYIDR